MPLFVPKDRKSLFRQFLAGMYDAVIITDPNGHVIEMNPRAVEHFGYESEEAVDRPIGTLVSGLAPEIVQRIRRALEEDRHVMIDANGVAKSGEKFACEVTVSILSLSDPDDLVFTVRNTERRRRMLNLYRAKANAFQVAQTALFACDAEGRFICVNDAFCEMFELEGEAAAEGHVFADFMGDEPLPANFRKALSGETTVTGVVAEGDGGDENEVEVVLAPNRSGRKIVGVVGSLRQVD